VRDAAEGDGDSVDDELAARSDVLGHALDERLIDKVQIYIAPIFTGGCVPAFGGNGARSTSESARLDRVAFEKIGPDLCVTGYPKYSAMGATE